MSATISLHIADNASPEDLRGHVMYRFTDEDGNSSPTQKAPAQAQAVLKSLFASGERAAVDAGKSEAEAKAARMAARIAELDARLNP